MKGGRRNWFGMQNKKDCLKKNKKKQTKKGSEAAPLPSPPSPEEVTSSQRS